MSDVRITCIVQSSANGGHEHITHVSSPQMSRPWTVVEVIQSIDAQTNTFYVLDPFNQRRANVGVQRPAGRRPFIQTYADGYWNNNLLSLSACPV